METSTDADVTIPFSCNISENLQPDKYITFIYVVYLMTIIGILTLVGNTVIIIIYVLYRDVRKSPSNIYILNLAVADICVGIFVMLYYPFFYFFGLQTFTVVKLLIIAILHHWFVNMSVFIVIFMCIDRYEMVSNILRYRKIQTRRRVSRIVVIGWVACLVYSIAINLLRYLTEDKITTNDRESCTPSIWDSYGKYTGWVTVVSFFVAFCIPFSLMVFFNAAVFKKLRLHSNWQDAIDPSEDINTNVRQRQKVSLQTQSQSISESREYFEANQPDRDRIKTASNGTVSLETKNLYKEKKEPNELGVDNLNLHVDEELSSKEIQNGIKVTTKVQFEDTTSIGTVHLTTPASISDFKFNVETDADLPDVDGKLNNSRVLTSGRVSRNGTGTEISFGRSISTISYPRRTSVVFERRKREAKKLRKAAFSLILFVMVYFICWLPFYLVSIATSFSDFSLNLVQAEQLTYMILLSNSCINPLIYPLMNARFRKGVLRLLTCQCNSRKIRRSQNSRVSEISRLNNL